MGGIDPESALSGTGVQGTRVVAKLNTETHRLTRMQDLPADVCANSTICLYQEDEKDWVEKPTVFLFGGLSS